MSKMKLLSKINSYFSYLKNAAFCWKKIDRVDVLIFERTNINYIRPLCRKNLTKSFEVRTDIIIINFKVMYYFVKHLIINFSPSPYTAYACAFIELSSPKIVITFIDNSEAFWDMARSLPNFRFLAIQNAARYEIVEMNYEEAKRIFIPEFACLGQYEEDLYKSKGANVGKYYKIGSLRESLYRNYIKKNIINLESYEYDLCVIAEASPNWDKLYPGIEDAFGKIAKYAVRMSEEEGLKLVIAGKRDLNPPEKRADFQTFTAESDWYKRYIGTYPITPRVRDAYSTYQLVSKSRISIALMSTALREGLSRGSRVLFCNYTGDPLWDFPVDGIWFLKEDGYEIFKERIQLILKMDTVEYRKKSASMKKYIINNDDKQPTQTFLENLISEAIGEGKKYE
jgi:surface carbohydrate biosynthesis protein